jgi:hypothetical protein
MARLSKAIFFTLTSLLFLCNALEVDACGVDNTFFDAYDTYVQSDTGRNIQSSVALEQRFVIVGLTEYAGKASELKFPEPRVRSSPGYYSPPLFIAHSNWRI